MLFYAKSLCSTSYQFEPQHLLSKLTKHLDRSSQTSLNQQLLVLVSSTRAMLQQSLPLNLANKLARLTRSSDRAHPINPSKLPPKALRRGHITKNILVHLFVKTKTTLCKKNHTTFHFILQPGIRKTYLRGGRTGSLKI